MKRRKPLDFDISVSSTKKKGSRPRGMSGAVEGATRTCEWEGCNKPAAYRAPKSRDQLDEFRWFCLDHVREYNKNWNYYAEMSEDEIAQSMEKDRAWGRPTWKLGQGKGGTEDGKPHADGEAWRRFGFDDPMQVLGENATLNPGAAREHQKQARERLLPKALRKALDVMALDSQANKQDIRLRNKEQVKRYNPDQNGGDRSEETRLREVLWAWDQLKGSDAFPE